MKEHTSNVLGYGTFLIVALLIGGVILTGNLARHKNVPQTSFLRVDEKVSRASLYDYGKNLEASGNPRDLLVSAFLQADNHPSGNSGMVPVPSPENITLLRSAFSLGHDDPTLAWIEALGCRWLDAACDTNAAINRLSKLDPDNAAVDLLQFNQAHAAGNVEVAWQALARGGSKKYFVLPIDAIGAMYFESLKDWHSPANSDPSFHFVGNGRKLAPVTLEEYRKLEAQLYGFSLGLPSFHLYASECKPSPTDPLKLLICQRFTEKLASGNTSSCRSIGTSIAIAIFSKPLEREKWNAEYNKHRWQLHQHSKLLKNKASAEREYLQQWPGISELQKIEMMLYDNGMSPTPPSGWTSKAIH